jgi:SPP1 gp7 family putative phage head morphogenesis protein
MACAQTANATASGDPTNTRQFREAFIDELRRRLERMRDLVRRTVGTENDALSLSANADPAEAFEFDSDAGRIEQFYRWFRQAIRDEVLEPVTRPEDGAHWTAEFVRRAYLIGWNQATGRLFQQGASIDNPDDEDVLNLPIPQAQLRQLYTRTFENLEGITTDAADRLREELTVGLDRGENPRKIARRLTGELDSITRTRTDVLARTEIINSHSTAALDRYEDAGVDVVSHGEWTTAGDDRVCPICEALEGRAFTIAEMRDTSFEMEGVSFAVRLRPPAHPNGRCTILPAVGADPPATPLQDRLPDSPAQQAANARVVA